MMLTALSLMLPLLAEGATEVHKCKDAKGVIVYTDQPCAKDAATPVRVAPASLSHTQREVIVLAYYGGYTQSEIAEHLDIPLGTVKSRTLTGMRRLHQQLSTDQQRAS